MSIGGGGARSSREAFREVLARYEKYDRELNLRLQKMCDAAPDDAIVHVGRALEAILTDYWTRSPEIKGVPNPKTELRVLIQTSLPVKRFEMIRVHADVLQIMRNLVAHTVSDVDEDDAADSVRRLVIILDWFARQRRAMDRAAAADSPAPLSPAAIQARAAAGPVPAQAGAPDDGSWEDGHPPLWTISATGAWACFQVRGQPVIVQCAMETIQVTDSRAVVRAVHSPGAGQITGLIATADGAALVIAAGETLAWADHDLGSRGPLRWVKARIAPEGRLLAGHRRKAGIEVIMADAGETFRLRVDSMGETARSVLAPFGARAVAVVGTGLALVAGGGELTLVNGAADTLPPLPDEGWQAVDAAYVGDDIGFGGLRLADGGLHLYTARQKRLVCVPLSRGGEAVQVSRGTVPDELASVIVVESGQVLRAWSCDDLQPLHRATAGPGQAKDGR